MAVAAAVAAFILLAEFLVQSMLVLSLPKRTFEPQALQALCIGVQLSP